MNCGLSGYKIVLFNDCTLPRKVSTLSFQGRRVKRSISQFIIKKLYTFLSTKQFSSVGRLNGTFYVPDTFLLGRHLRHHKNKILDSLNKMKFNHKNQLQSNSNNKQKSPSKLFFSGQASSGSNIKDLKMKFCATRQYFSNAV